MTIFNSRFVRRIGALNMFRSGLDTVYYGSVDGHQCTAGAGILVAGGWRCGVCGLRVDGVINAMAVILDEFPHMAGTASSLAGTFRFGIGAIVGALLFFATFNSAWPMIWSIAFCATSSILFCLYASRPKNSDYCTTRKLKGFLC